MIVGVVGGCSVDHVVRVPDGVRFDLPGGPGLFASIGAKLTFGSAGEVRFGGSLPEDAPELDAAFSAAEVDLAWAPRRGRAARLWILDSREGRRVLHTRPTSSELSDADEHDTMLRAPEVGFAKGLDALLLCAPSSLPGIDIAASTLVAADPDQTAISSRGWEYLEELGSRAQILLPSRVQLAQLAALDDQTPDPEGIALRIRERTGMSVVARVDADGAIVVDDDATPRRVSAAAVEVVDTTGAGDSHAGALVAAFLQSGDLFEAARVAAQVVTHTLAGWGPEGALAALAETED